MLSFFTTHVSPIIYYLVAFILGISLRPYALLLIPCCLILGLILYLITRHKLIALCCSMIAFGCATHQTYLFLYERAAATIPDTPITIAGTITDMQKTNHHLFKHLIIVALESIDGTPTSRINPHNHIHIYTSTCPSFEVDDQITVENVRCKKPPPSSYRGHLMREHTIATMFTPKLIATSVIKPTWSYKRWVHNTKIAVTQRATNALQPVTQSLYASLFLGNKTYTSTCYESIKEQFRRWGLSHYLARSGLHLVLIVALWIWLFRIIPIPFIHKQLSIALLVLIYAILSWSSISFIRALSTFFLCKICSCIWHHYYNNLHLLTLTAFYLLIQNPLHIFYLDFQLSFGITFALAWLQLLKTYQNKIEAQTIASS